MDATSDGETYSGMAVDPTPTGDVYASSTTWRRSSLFQENIGDRRPGPAWRR
ncbi:MAG: hypothetical protein R2844_03445 [Caldilineales bacterium]